MEEDTIRQYPDLIIIVHVHDIVSVIMILVYACTFICIRTCGTMFLNHLSFKMCNHLSWMTNDDADEDPFSANTFEVNSPQW